MEKRIQEQSFWTLPIDEVIRLLGTQLQTGLPRSEVDTKLRTFGPNIIEKSRQISGLLIVLNQFKSPLILILVIAGTVTLLINHLRDAFFIFAAVFINTALGFFQENKAEKALAELKTYLKQRARVIRDGIEQEIDAAGLVPGDVLRLAQGDRVPADCRLAFVNDFQVDEAILTGEALPVIKSIAPSGQDASLGDQDSMVFAGTLVTQGVATAVACRTGFSTELGKIATLVAASHREETPLQKKIERFSFHAGVLLLFMTVGVFIVGITLGYSAVEMFLISVAIAVSAVPEGLPMAMTVILAIGVQRMARRKGVVRKLVAAEALGSTTVILTDKTGTLTSAQMKLSTLAPEKGEDEEQLLRWALMNTNVLVENPADPIAEWRVSGRVLETSLVKSAAARGILISDLKGDVDIVYSLPFNAANKFSVSLVRKENKKELIFFGAPDLFVLHSLLDPHERDRILGYITARAEVGELVVGVATKEIAVKDDFTFSQERDFQGLVFRGVLAFRDPVRPNVKEAIRKVELAGIRTVVVTGDHRGTAEVIAREVGIPVVPGSVLDSGELHALSDVELRSRLSVLRVIARVSPVDKMRIVKAFQDAGEVVAMTGDGVNDAPSIKQADIGIAMGSGTEVARDVADIVLLDDNFETIAAAVEEGRQITSNIKKVLVYLLSSVADELLLISGALLAGLTLPLNALQILYVNFFSDSFPAIAFAFEKDSQGLRSEPPRSRSELFDPMMKFLIIFIGFSTSALLFLLYWVLLKMGFEESMVRTFIFASFGTYSLFLAVSLRDFNRNIISYSPFSNRYLVGGIGIGLVMMIGAIYLPFMQKLFGTVALPPSWLLGVIAVGVVNIIAVEYGKRLYKKS